MKAIRLNHPEINRILVNEKYITTNITGYEAPDVYKHMMSHVPFAEPLSVDVMFNPENYFIVKECLLGDCKYKDNVFVAHPDVYKEWHYKRYLDLNKILEEHGYSSIKPYIKPYEG